LVGNVEGLLDSCRSTGSRGGGVSSISPANAAAGAYKSAYAGAQEPTDTGAGKQPDSAPQQAARDCSRGGADRASDEGAGSRVALTFF